MLRELHRSFKPEFLNRIDEIVLFKPLRKEEIIKIIDLTLQDVLLRLKDRNIELDITPAAKEFMADNSYDPMFGARPVKRYIQKYIETQIGKMIIKGEVEDGGKITVDADEMGLVIS